jgi:hypothetical protein
MTALLDAIARVFVAPTAGARAEPVSAVAAPSAAVCGPGAEPVACALALLLRRRGPVIVCRWGVEPRRGALPATAGARRLAASMAARGLSAQASGRLVGVALDEMPSVAAAEGARATAAAGESPVVLALCGPRDPAFDDLLAAQDVAIVALQDASAELVRLGVAALEETSRRAVAAPVLAGPSAWAARAGLWAGPGARRALADATDVLR